MFGQTNCYWILMEELGIGEPAGYMQNSLLFSLSTIIILSLGK